jgi:hypothetical protein
MIGMLMAMGSVDATAAFDPGNLVQEAAQGHADNVRAIVSRYPGQVSVTRSQIDSASYTAQQYTMHALVTCRRLIA